MAVYDTAAENGSDASIDERDARALTQYLTVLDDVGRATGAEDRFLVVSESGESYLVDAARGVCECADAEYRAPAGGCKHVRRVAFATGERAIPAWIDREPVDPDLGEHVDGEVRFAATDGGVVDERAAIARAVDRQVLTGMVCGNVVGEDLPDWEVYNVGAAASQATIERVLEGDADA